MAERAPGTVVGQVDEKEGLIWNGARWVYYGDTPQVPNERNPSTAMGVIGRALNSQRPDTGAAAAQRALAEESTKGAAERRQEAQQHAQIANRDARVEGDKDAATSAAAQFNQKVAQTSGAAGAGAAVLAAQNVQDPSQRYDTHRQRADTQRMQAEELNAAARGEEQEAINRRAFADELAATAQQDTVHNNAARNLSNAASDEAEEEQEGQRLTPAEAQTQSIQHFDERIKHALADAGLDPNSEDYANWYRVGYDIAMRALKNPTDTAVRTDWKWKFQDPVDKLGKANNPDYELIGDDPLFGRSRRNNTTASFSGLPAWASAITSDRTTNNVRG